MSTDGRADAEKSRINVFVCLFWLLFRCGWERASMPWALATKTRRARNVVILQKEDSGREVVVKSGDVIQIELSGSGGTGYWWYVTKMDSKYAELASEETKAPSDKKLWRSNEGHLALQGKSAGQGRPHHEVLPRLGRTGKSRG